MDSATKSDSIPAASVPIQYILKAIFIEKEKGLLVTRLEDGSLTLPGVTIIRSASHADAQAQINHECRRIRKSVFEQCGLSLDVIDASGSFYLQLTDSETETVRNYKIFVMEQRSSPAGIGWKRLASFDAEFIRPDYDVILDLYPTLTFTDKEILLAFFTAKIPRADDQGYPRPRAVITF